jgi:hypothetical protein
MVKQLSLWSLIGVLLLWGCSKFDPTYDEINGIQSEWLLPIAKTSIGFENIKEISSVDFDVYLTPAELGYPSNITVDVPAAGGLAFGPYLRPLPDIVHRIDYDSLKFTVSLVNGFPFSLSPGTTINFRNTPNFDPANILFSWQIGDFAPPGGTLNFAATSSANYFEDYIYVTIENLGTPGGNDLVFSGLPLSISADFEVIDLQEIQLQTNKEILSIDTLSISVEEPGDTFGVATGGAATIYFDNLLPANQRFQAYFLQNGNVLDSLLAEPGTIVGCNVTPSGDPLSMQSTKAIAPLSWAKWTKIASCDKLVIHHYLNTNNYNGSIIKANEQCKIDLQLVVDVMLNINISEL